MGATKEEIGERIRQVRLALKMTQIQLGDVMGVGKSSISAYESGTNDTSPALLVKISKLSGRSLEWLITGNEPLPVKPEITYPLADDEKRAVATANDILERYGLGKQFAVVEIHHPPPQEERLSEYEKRLVEAFRKVDKQSQEVILTVAENTALAFSKGDGRSRPGGDGSPETNCA